MSESTVKKWPRTCRALGKEALFATKRRRFSHEEKTASPAVVDNRVPKPEAIQST